MQSVNIRTTQNVAIDYKLAGVVDRIVATLIDLAIMVAYVILIVQILQEIKLNSVWIGLSFFLPVFLYHLISEMAMGGHSLGKKVVDVKVVRLDGTQPTIGNYILRWILMPVDIGIFSGAITKRVHANKAPVIAATEKVKTRLNIQSDLPPVKFLHTIVKDFNYLTSRE